MFSSSKKLTKTESLDRRTKAKTPKRGSHCPSFRSDLFVRSSSNSSDKESDVNDEGDIVINPKPHISYAIIISDVIENSPNKKLTLNDIYLGIQEKYPYFKSATPSWKNSIRHNLSLN